MGSCFSTHCNNAVNLLTVKVVSSNGNLLEYSVPVTVSEVLKTEPSSCFLCNSDNLSYEDYTPVLDSDEQLQLGQIYFILPKSRLQYRLKASDMAALAIKASSALGKSSSSSKGCRWGQKNKRISPVFAEVKNNQRELGGDDKCDDRLKTFEKQNFGILTSGSVRNLQRIASSRRAKRNNIKSFRMRLTTIYESSDAN